MMAKKYKVKEIKEMVKRKVEELQESTQFMAQRKVLLRATEASMDFEKEMISQLDLLHPDQMPPESQKVYHQIVSRMSDRIKSAVADAVIALGHASLPKESDAKEQPKVTYHEAKSKRD